MCKEEENTSHISRCKSMQATECREYELEVMEKELEKANTNPSLIVLFLAALTNIPDQREEFPG